MRNVFNSGAFQTLDTGRVMAATRMYILVRARIPLGFAAVSIAHASLSCYRQFEADPHMQKWAAESYRKCVCSVTDEQFIAAKAVKDHVLVTESAYGHAEIALAFCPRPSKRWPREFEDFPLYDAPLREGDRVDVGGIPGRVVALNGDQDNPGSVRVEFADRDLDVEWWHPADVMRVHPNPEKFKL